MQERPEFCRILSSVTAFANRVGVIQGRIKGNIYDTGQFLRLSDYRSGSASVKLSVFREIRFLEIRGSGIFVFQNFIPDFTIMAISEVK
jgi:hypothetical protein